MTQGWRAPPSEHLSTLLYTEEGLALDRTGGLQFARQAANAEVITAPVEAVLGAAGT